MFTYSLNNGLVDIGVSVEGGREELNRTFILSQRLFSLVTRQVEEIEKKYGRNHLHFSIVS